VARCRRPWVRTGLVLNSRTGWRRGWRRGRLGLCTRLSGMTGAVNCKRILQLRTPPWAPARSQARRECGTQADSTLLMHPCVTQRESRSWVRSCSWWSATTQTPCLECSCSSQACSPPSSPRSSTTSPTRRSRWCRSSRQRHPHWRVGQHCHGGTRREGRPPHRVRKVAVRRRARHGREGRCGQRVHARAFNYRTGA
jgi:hypothetical protein